MFVTYGDRHFQNSKILLCNEAVNFGFTKFFVGSPEHLTQDFVEKHRDFLNRSSRGAGYWLWKPFIVKNCLNSINYGDFLLYVDAGCSVNSRGKARFKEWIDLCDEKESLSFQMNHLPEKSWSKMSLVNYLECNRKDYLESGQINATTFLLKKTPKIIHLVNEWLDVSSLEWTIDDTQSDVPNDSSFSDHRHDQSVFSLLRKKYSCFSIEDETYPSKNHDWNDASVRNVPILATRRRF
jgi:hypothetical protein